MISTDTLILLLSKRNQHRLNNLLKTMVFLPAQRILGNEKVVAIPPITMVMGSLEVSGAMATFVCLAN